MTNCEPSSGPVQTATNMFPPIISIDERITTDGRVSAFFAWFFTAPATAQVLWKRVATDTTLTVNQLCKADGTNIFATAPRRQSCQGWSASARTSPPCFAGHQPEDGCCFVARRHDRNPPLRASNGMIRYNSALPGGLGSLMSCLVDPAELRDDEWCVGCGEWR